MGKILVAYFSATGATMRLAEKISKMIDGDLFEIEPVVKYSETDLKWPSKMSRSALEMKDKDYRPAVVNKVKDIDQYDKILLGFPIWYNTAPTIVNTFIEQNNLLGKDVYIFVTSGAHTFENSIKDLQKSYPMIHFINGKRFNGSFPKKDVFEWINGKVEG